MNNNVGYRINILILIALCFFGCDKRESKEDVTEYRSPYFYKNNPNSKQDISLDQILMRNKDNEVSLQVYTLKQDAGLVIPGVEPDQARIKLIKQLKAGTKVKLIARSGISSGSNNDVFYLVRLNNENLSWSGWINDSSIIHPNILIDNLILLGPSSISPDNDTLIFGNREKRKLFIINNNGIVLAEFFYTGPSDNEKYDGYPIGSFVLGWDILSRYVWIETHFGEIATSFIRIDMERMNIIENDAPSDFDNYNYVIDFTNGNCLYLSEFTRTERGTPIYEVKKYNIVDGSINTIASSTQTKYRVFYGTDREINYSEVIF